MSRLPITIRLTLAFAAVMAAVFAGTGVFLYLRLESELDRTVQEGLRSRADDVAAFVQRSGASSRAAQDERLTDVEESFAQILDERGFVLGASPGVGARSLLTPQEAARAQHETVLVSRRVLPHINEDALRLLATPTDGAGERLVVIVGTSISDHDEALADLARHLLIGGPIALLLATLTAFGVARAALRPVESMRRQASVVSGAEPGRRLPLPRTRDELWRLGETLNAMLARLEAAIARERTFVSDAGHELRTPLTILKMELDLALRHGRSQEDLREAVESAAEETERLIRIAEDLLAISSSQQRKLPLQRDRHDAGDVLAAVVQRFAALAEETGVDLGATSPPGLILDGDRPRLEQALGNLVDNAIRHGGGSVELSAVQRDGVVELHVADEGPGFPPDFLEHAFERFSRADEARSDGGTGLGLAVVSGIAAAHGGQAQAVNRRPAGTDVWLTLPADPLGDAPAAGLGSQLTPSVKAVPQRP